MRPLPPTTLASLCARVSAQLDTKLPPERLELFDGEAERRRAFLRAAHPVVLGVVIKLSGRELAALVAAEPARWLAAEPLEWAEHFAQRRGVRAPESFPSIADSLRGAVYRALMFEAGAYVAMRRQEAGEAS